MKIKELLSKEITKKIICVVLLLAIALLSIFVFSKVATNPATYRETLQSIDDKKATVMGLTATSATAATVLASLPGDATTPIANQIMEISAYLLIVVCVLVLEKSLLTVMGYLSFNILIPVACGLLGFYAFIKKEKLKVLAIKFLALALILVTIIPLSLKLGDLIYDINRTTVEQVTEKVDATTNQEESWLTQTLNTLKDGVAAAGEKAKQILNSFIDAIALFIITYCLIPIIVLLLVVWFVKFLFGITIPLPKLNSLPLPKKPTKKNNQEV